MLKIHCIPSSKCVSIISYDISSPKSARKNDSFKSNFIPMFNYSKSLDSRTPKDAESFTKYLNKNKINIIKIKEENNNNSNDLNKKNSHFCFLIPLENSNIKNEKQRFDSLQSLLEKMFMNSFTTIFRYKSQRCNCPLLAHDILKEARVKIHSIFKLIVANCDIFKSIEFRKSNKKTENEVLQEKLEVIKTGLALTQKVISFLNSPILNQKWANIQNHSHLIHKYSEIFFLTEVISVPEINSFLFIINRDIGDEGKCPVPAEYADTWNHIAKISINRRDYSFESTFINNYKRNCFCFYSKNEQMMKNECLGHLKGCKELIGNKANSDNQKEKVKEYSEYFSSCFENEWNLFEAKIEEYERNNQYIEKDKLDRKSSQLNFKSIKKTGNAVHKICTKDNN